MNINVDGLTKEDMYDERNLTLCRCGCGRKFPSKKMFVEFLKQYKDIDAEVFIIAEVEDHLPDEFKYTIRLSLEYLITNRKKKEK